MGRKSYYLLVIAVVIIALLIIIPYEVTILRRNEVEEPVRELEVEDIEAEVDLEDVIDLERLDDEITLDTDDLEARLDEVEKHLVAAEERDPVTDLKITHTEKTSAEPDFASVTMAVENRGEDIDEIFVENRNIMAEAREQLGEEFGLDFETLMYQLRRYDDEQYIVANRIKTEIEELDKLGEIIDQAVDAGINRVEDISYDIKDRGTIQKNTTADAISSIKAKAGRITAEFGSPEYRFKEVEIDDDFSVHQSRSFVHYDVRAEEAAAAGTEITPGDIEIKTTVRAVVEF